MLKQLLGFCTVLVLILQLWCAQMTMAWAQGMSDVTDAAAGGQVTAAETVTERDSSAYKCTARLRERVPGQKVTYPEPPDVYDYETIRQYDEEIYGEKDLPASSLLEESALEESA